MRVTQYSSKYRVLIRGSLVIWKRLIRTRTHHWITRRRNKTRMYHRTPTRECEHCRIARKGRRPLPPQRSTEIAERNRVDTSVRATSIHCTSQPTTAYEYSAHAKHLTRWGWEQRRCGKSTENVFKIPWILRA